jgi:hypothetical protein
MVFILLLLLLFDRRMLFKFTIMTASDRIFF